jgi:hypothetical protein
VTRHRRVTGVPARLRRTRHATHRRGLPDLPVLAVNASERQTLSDPEHSPRTRAVIARQRGRRGSPEAPVLATAAIACGDDQGRPRTSVTRAIQDAGCRDYRARISDCGSAPPRHVNASVRTRDRHRGAVRADQPGPTVRPSGDGALGSARYSSSSYLNDTRSLVRNGAAPFSSRSRSCSSTSATRRLRIVSWAGVLSRPEVRLQRSGGCGRERLTVSADTVIGRHGRSIISPHGPPTPGALARRSSRAGSEVGAERHWNPDPRRHVDPRTMRFAPRRVGTRRVDVAVVVEAAISAPVRGCSGLQTRL